MAGPAFHRDRALHPAAPRRVTHECSVCAKEYQSTAHNPSWSLAMERCPYCDVTQFPRIDIEIAANCPVPCTPDEAVAAHAAPPLPHAVNLPPEVVEATWHIRIWSLNNEE